MLDNTRLLRPRDPDWDAYLQRVPHDFYHLAAYHDFAERMGEGRAMMLIAEAGPEILAWPYLLRDLVGGLSDATSVYGYAGPVGSIRHGSSFRDAAWSAFLSMWREQRVVSLFTNLHPLIGNVDLVSGLRGASSPAKGEVVRLGPSVSIDLSEDFETRRKGYPRIFRQEVNKSERDGLTVELDEEWTAYPRFIELYHATMCRNDATERYLFSETYFRELHAALGGNAHLSVARVDGDVAAALLFTVHRGIAQAHLTGVNGDFARLSPLKALFDRTCEIARELGADVLHLGAGRGGAEDSLFAFKARFSNRRHDFVLGRWIIDAESYERLAQERGVEDDGSFFPAYRKPPAAAQVGRS